MKKTVKSATPITSTDKESAVAEPRKINRYFLLAGVVIVMIVLLLLGSQISRKNKKPIAEDRYQPSSAQLQDQAYVGLMSDAKKAMQTNNVNDLKSILQKAQQKYPSPAGKENVDFLYIEYQIGAIQSTPESYTKNIEIAKKLQTVLDQEKTDVLRSSFDLNPAIIKDMNQNLQKPGGIAGGEG